ncbi:MAG TPA: agmatinase, partial [Acidimicrobiaceae bacterium]|nr:agmatinase [Acidimicrobiaceae bacterium]
MSEPRRDVSPGLQQQLDQGYAFGSVRTFCQQPLLTSPDELDAWQPDVALVGAPFDLGTTNRPGARFGPRALRADAYLSGTYHLGLGLELFDWLSVVDYGDAHCPNGLVDQSLANIRSRVHEVASRGIVPFVIGGDHTITWPSATAVADVYGYGRVGMIHFDAHADTADGCDGNLASHGTPMRRLIDSGAVPGRNFVQVGLRSYWPPQETWDWMAEQGMRWHLMDEIWERGFKAVMADALDEAMDGCDHLYISIDIDSLDPAHAPATGTPEPGGIVAADLLRMVREIAYRHPVVAMDVVEVAPAYDHADCTINVAHRLFTECLAGMAAKRRDAAGTP